MNKKIELVFRTVNERTSKLAMELAIRNIAPDKIHVIENVKPFTKAVEQMLQIDFDCDMVVFMDADCLIMEDMRPFLNKNNLPYVDCYVMDKFRGRIHAGVHITRTDVVQAMKAVKIPENDERYVLRPESRLRNFALRELNLWKAFKDFKIFHDYCQYYHDIFVKYALRELRSRADEQQQKFEVNMQTWNLNDMDFRIARHAVDFTRDLISSESSPQELHDYIKQLPDIAKNELAKMNIVEKGEVAEREVVGLNDVVFSDFVMENQHKVFGIGLSRTGTKSLTSALNILGFNVVHYPVEKNVIEELSAGTYDFTLLEDLDGITDITVAPYYAQLDKLYPNSKFILTVREKESWLVSLEKHWKDRPAYDKTEGKELHMEIRRFLRASVYGAYRFNRDRMTYVYDKHYKDVVEYFKNRPNKLLILNIPAGEGWEKLCPFLERNIPDEPFPAVNKKADLVTSLQATKSLIDDEK